MLSVDLHIHSLFSSCGLHTILELIERSHALGLKAIAITDHGLSMSGERLTSVFFERFQSPYPDLTLYKGIELNLLEERGRVDIPFHLLTFMDIVLCGVHPNLKKLKKKEYYTDLLLAAVDANPFIDIITHPNDPFYPLDYNILAKKAAGTGMALELNNSKILYKRSTVEDALALVLACKKAGCRMAVSSDTHAIHELGLDDSVRHILAEAAYPAELIVNRSLESAASFIEERRKLKKRATVNQSDS